MIKDIKIELIYLYSVIRFCEKILPTISSETKAQCECVHVLVLFTFMKVY